MKFKRLNPDAALPRQQNPGDAGYDLTAIAPPNQLPSGIDLYSTGVAVAIPDGYVGLVFDRSGVATQRGMTRVAGVIDASYRGEIKVALASVGGNAGAPLRAGDRIAQLVIVPCVTESSEWADDLGSTDRGANGFGSTGS